MLDLHGWGDVGAELHALLEAGKSSQAPAVVPGEMINGLCIVADTWTDALRSARERYAGVASRFSFYLSDGFVPPNGIRSHISRARGGGA